MKLILLFSVWDGIVQANMCPWMREKQYYFMYLLLILVVLFLKPNVLYCRSFTLKAFHWQKHQVAFIVKQPQEIQYICHQQHVCPLLLLLLYTTTHGYLVQLLFSRINRQRTSVSSLSHDEPTWFMPKHVCTHPSIQIVKTSVNKTSFWLFYCQQRLYSTRAKLCSRMCLISPQTGAEQKASPAELQ